MIGQQIGPYVVLSKLGAGGMGEVYRAKDTNLNRDVALKILPEQFTSDAERVARFKREAQTLASLNHPNIAAIYGVEQSALVMELVEGEDLSTHIGQGPIALSDALPIVRQILDALEAAHEQGIVHRDLKPQNIKVRDDGTVKVLDFGLAKALATEGAERTGGTENSPTLTARATQLGVILGTASYMSPEQARGRAVDKRTDVWALGCVIYEMLTGAKAFTGEDATEIISSVVKSDPDLKALPASVPPHIRAIVERCLTKDRKARIPDVSVVRYILDDAMGTKQPDAQPAMASARPSWMWPAVAAVLALAALAAGVAWYRARDVEPIDARFSIVPPDGATFASSGFSGVAVPAISPDGRMVAFSAQDATGKRMLYVRPIDSLVAQQFPGTEGAAYPSWSPDGKYIAFTAPAKLLKVAATGGPPQLICNLLPGIVSRGNSWSPDGVIIFNNGPTLLYRAPTSGGGTAEPIGKLAFGQNAQQFPFFLPDGRHFIFHGSGTPEATGIYLGSLDSSESTRLIASDNGAVYDPASGRLLFMRQGALIAQSLDLKTNTLTGDAVLVAERVEGLAVPGIVAFSISKTGVLAYGTGLAAGSVYRLVWLNRQGKQLGILGPEGDYRGLALSPNEQQVVVHRHDGAGGDLWLIDVTRNSVNRFTLDPTQENSSPVWSPAGDRIAFQSTRDGKAGVYVAPTNGAGTSELLTEATATQLLAPQSWSPDGASLMFGVRDPKTGLDLWTVLLDPSHKAAPRLQSAGAESSGKYSPDGKWLAYQSNENGPVEIFVQSATGMPGKWSISTGGGSTPRWRADSKELYYAASGKIWAVEIGTKGSALVPGVPQALFEFRGVPNATHPTYFTSYDVTKDGQKFLVTRRESDSDSSPASPLVIVLNWRKVLK